MQDLLLEDDAEGEDRISAELGIIKVKYRGQI